MLSVGDSVEMEVPEMPSSEMSSCKDTSSFSQVVFPSISDYFPPGQDVQVSYILAETIEQSSRDWLGLFKVGWTSPREYVTFIWAPKAGDRNSGNRSVSATFQAYYLPKNSSEFYQFCYVTKQGQVRGASTPFQFRNTTETDLVEIEDESGIIMLKTKSAVLEEQFAALTKEKLDLESKMSHLKSANAQLEGSCQASNSQIAALQKGIKKKETECDELNKRIVALNDRLEKVKSCLKNAEEKLGKQKGVMKENAEALHQLEKEKAELSTKLQAQQEENKGELSCLVEQLDSKSTQLSEMEAVVIDMTRTLEERKVEETAQKSELTRDRDAAKAQTTQYKEEISLYRTQLAKSKESHQGALQKLTAATDKLASMDNDIQDKASKLLAYEEKSKMLKHELREAEKKLVVEKVALEKQITNLEDKLNASEASKRLISSELTEARDRRDMLMSELIQAKKAKEQMTRDLDASRRQLSELDKNFNEVKEQAVRGEQKVVEKQRKLESERAQAKEREKSLREQIKLIKSQLESADKAVATAASAHLLHETNENATQTKAGEKKDVEGDELDVNELKMQIEDLRTRLSMGAAAYTEKYKECHKLERKMKKIQHSKSAPKTDAKTLDDESATADSQEDMKSDAKSKRATKQELEDPPAGGNLMSKLEQFFMAIADPDVEANERANNLKLRLEELEGNVKFQHGRYRKYKQLYQEERKARVAEQAKSESEILRLKRVEAEKETLQHENDALKAQLMEFVENSRDENVVKTREIVIPTAAGVTSIPRSGYPHEDSESQYPHASLQVKDSSSDSDVSGEFHMANSGFAPGLLCPNKEASDDVDTIAIPRPNGEVLTPTGGVINRQPTRSPPMIEIISSGSDEMSASPKAAGSKPGAKKSGRNRRSRGKGKNHKLA